MARSLRPIVERALGRRYAIEAELGRGATSVVFRAIAPNGQMVALKVLRPELSVTVTAERFLREVAIVKRLDHPKIGRLLDAGEREWLVFYVTPFVSGRSLDHLLSERGQLGVGDTIQIGADLLDALAHAHGHGVVHRDVKPENVMIAADGAHLLDFGIARAVALSGTDRLTRSGVAVGTSQYMSPEQIMALDDPDPRSDLYSVGCVLFECLAGRPPYHHPNEVRVLQLHQTAPVPDVRDHVPAAPRELAEAIARALAKRREDRWQSAAEMAASLPAIPPTSPA